MIKLTYCYCCYEELYSYGAPAVCAYEVICESIAQSNQPALISPYEDTKVVDEIVKFLEIKGFVVTCDIGEDYIAVKPNGFMKKQDDDFIVCPLGHFEDNCRD